MAKNLRDFIPKKTPEESGASPKKTRQSRPAGPELMRRFNGIVDRKGRLQFASEAPIKELGYDEDDVLRKPFWQAEWFSSSPKSQKIIKDGVLGALDGKSARCEVEASTKDGTSLPVTLVISPLKGKDGDIVSITAEAGPVVEKPEKPSATEEQVNALLEIINEPYFQTDSANKLTVISLPAANLLGYKSPDELIGKRMADLWIDSEDQDKYLMQLSRKGKVQQYEAVFQKKNKQEIPVELGSRLTFDSKGEVAGIEGIFRDLTETTEIQELSQENQELKQRIASLEEAEEQQVQAYNTDLEEANEQLQQEIADLKEDQETLQANNTKIEEANNQLQHKITELKDANEQLQQEIADIKEEQDSAQADSAELKATNKELNQEIADLKKEQESLQERTDELEAANEKLNKDLVGLERADEALKESDDYFQTLLGHISEGITVIDPDGTIRYQSPSAEQIFGYNADENLGKIASDFVHPDDAPAVIEALAELAEQPGTAISMQCRYRAEDDSWRLMECAARNCADDPLLQGIIVTSRDITDVSREEEAEGRREEYYRALVENKSSDILVIDAAGAIQYESPSAELESQQLSGFGATGQIDINSFEFVHPDDLEMVTQNFNELLQNPGSTITGDCRVKFKDGSWHHLEVTSTNLLENPAVGGIVLSRRDITDRREAETKLMESESKLKDILANLRKSHEELSTPVVQIWDHILALPLVGVLDTHRARQVMDVLLTKIMETRAQVVVIDVTGVDTMDTQVTNHLIQTAQSTRLLGAECVITGVKPEVAQAMVHIGADMAKLATKRDLQEGLKHGLNMIGYGFGEQLAESAEE